MMKNNSEKFIQNRFATKKAILLVALLIGGLPLFGQGWELIYEENSTVGVDVIETTDGGFLTLAVLGSFQNESAQILKTDASGNIDYVLDIPSEPTTTKPNHFIRLLDGSFIITGSQRLGDFSFPESEGFIMKVDANGNVLWRNAYGDGFEEGQQERFRKIVPTPDGGFISAGTISVYDQSTGYVNLYGQLLKIDGDGNQEWYQNYQVREMGEIIPTSDGNYILLGVQGVGSHIIKINPQGEEIWSHTHSFGDYINQNRIIETPDQHLMLAGMVNLGNPNDLSNVFLRKLSPDGSQVLFTKVYSKPNFQEWVHDFKMTSDGGFAIAGYETPVIELPLLLKNSKAFLIKTDANGQQLWRRKYGTEWENAYTQLFGMNALDDGFIFCGSDNDISGNGDQLYLVKTDHEGRIRSRFIKGNVFNDLDVSCSPNPGEIGLSNWIVIAHGEGKIFNTNTDDMGNYLLEVDSGAYNVIINYPSTYWEACASPVFAEIYAPYDSTTVDFPVQANFDCPFMTVNIGTPFIRWCSENYYTVSYCNNGTIEATDAYVEVTLDQSLTLNNSEIPVASQDGNTYTFNIGNVGINECDYFVINAELGCDEDIQGSTHCTEAHIYPDSLCGNLSANWDGSSIEVEGICQGDSITFIITNIGDGDMSEPANYVIIEDQIMMLQGNFDLGSNESTSITIATTGGTFRIEADQSAFHPGNSMPSSVVEGCGEGPFSFGWVNTFSLNDFDNYLDIDCTANISSFDPNDKLGIPIGYDVDKFIRPGTDIDYRIRFQNTGTDTAFLVVIEDELSPWLDITTIRLGAFSHEYDLKIEDNNTLIFTFDNIMLPDSNVNEVASHGFLKFKISHVDDIPLGTQIYNKAGIYFDANSPVITNTTLHTVQENFIVSIDDLENNNNATNTLFVAPNPTVDYAIFEMKEAIDNGQLLLHDATGRLVRSVHITGRQFQLESTGLAKGIYFFQILEQKNQVFSGKIIIQ